MLSRDKEEDTVEPGFSVPEPASYSLAEGSQAESKSPQETHQHDGQEKRVSDDAITPESGEDYAFRLEDSSFNEVLFRELQKDMNLSFALEKGKKPVINSRTLEFFPSSSFAGERIQASCKTILSIVHRLTGQSVEIKIHPVEQQVLKNPDDPWSKQVNLVKDIFRGEVISQS